MKTQPAYFVINTNGRRPRVDRVRASWPSLEPGEVILRLALDIPDSLVPQLQEIVLDDPDSMGIAIEPVPLEV